MSTTALIIIFAAGLAGVVYSLIGKRVGYGNSRQVWTITLSTFVFGVVVFFLAFKLLIHRG